MDKRSQVPQGKMVTYAWVVAKLGAQKEEPERDRIKLGGNLMY